MSSADITAIHAELNSIRVAIYVIGALVLVTVILGALRTYWVVKKGVARELDGLFRLEAQDLLERNEYDRLVVMAADAIRERPNNVTAHWYLARAYYMKEHWVAAEKEFELVGKLEPPWNKDFVEPYVAEIRRRAIVSPSANERSGT